VIRPFWPLRRRPAELLVRIVVFPEAYRADSEGAAARERDIATARALIAALRPLHSLRSCHLHPVTAPLADSTTLSYDLVVGDCASEQRVSATRRSSFVHGPP